MLCLSVPMPLVAATSEAVTYTGQFLAFAPNAGGQTAYALRRATQQREWSLFANTYLTSADVPLSGITYAIRHSLCQQYCVAQAYVQTGIGLSTAGPVAEILWGTTLLWTVRIDFATQIFVAPRRLIFWSYPLWVGLSLSL